MSEPSRTNPLVGAPLSPESFIYSSNEAQRELLARLGQVRQRAGKTQESVAKKMGTSKSNVSRLEKNTHSPTLGTLIEYVQALGYQFHVVLTPDNNT